MVVMLDRDGKEIMKSTTWSQDRYIAALHFAAEAHAGAVISGTVVPYIVHPVRVTMELMAAIVAEGVSEPDLAVSCALLHDVLEDTPTPFGAIEAAFGRRGGVGCGGAVEE